MDSNHNIKKLPLNSSACIISARRYGDAIMNARIAKAASQLRPDIHWVIWTKPEFSPLFNLMGFTKIITSEFPIAGGAPKFVKDGGRSLMKAIRQLRHLNLNASVDFIGDTREAFLGFLISGRGHHSPRWLKTHWMHRLIWSVMVPFVSYSKIHSKQERMYEIAAVLLSKLTGEAIELERQISKVNSPPKIAFHPFSSQAFKSWPDQFWQSLSLQLNKNNIYPTVFCTELEKSKAGNIFLQENIQVKIKATKSLEDLIRELQSIDLLVGIDSFLVHLASALGIKTIVINSGNLPQWWQPPNSIALGQSGGCSNYPCSNEPSCLGSINESRCIKSIEPQQVMDVINKIAYQGISE